MDDWDLDLTENGYVPTGADVSSDGGVSIGQDTFPNTMENQRVDLSFEQMRKIVDRFCAVTGYVPNQN